METLTQFVQNTPSIAGSMAHQMMATSFDLATKTMVECQSPAGRMLHKGQAYGLITSMDTMSRCHMGEWAEMSSVASEILNNL